MALKKAKAIRLLPALFFFIYCLSCSSIGPTRPNEPYPAPYLDSLDRLSEKNPLLAKEIGKLPELQDGISSKDAHAIDNILEMYSKNPNAFENSLAEMYKIGIPEVRRYSSPLQALYWLAEDNRTEEATSFLANDFSLKTLLNLAWNFNDQRWQDFYVVMDRLNSPELIDYYERSRFHYDYKTGHGGDFKEVLYVFKHNKGHCLQISAFTAYCLRRAGYRAKIQIIVHPRYRSPMGNDHRVCLFEIDERQYIMDNGRAYPFGIIPLDEYNIENNIFLMKNDYSYEAVWKELR